MLMVDGSLLAPGAELVSRISGAHVRCRNSRFVISGILFSHWRSSNYHSQVFLVLTSAVGALHAFLFFSWVFYKGWTL